MVGILTPSAPAPSATPVVHAPAAAAPLAAPVRVKIGGVVKPPEMVHRVEPVYPPLARQARISGVVELEGVIGVDGRMRELQVRNGHPPLVRAAMDAVAQWVFRPTLLNGEPVEVIEMVFVRFNLQ
jgi:protein TonB